MKKKKVEQETITTIFDIPVKEVKSKLQELNVLFCNIIKNPKFAEISSKIPVPEGATRVDIERMVQQFAPKKIEDIFSLLVDDNFENIIKMLSIIFCQEYDFYATKSINQICDDIYKLSKTQFERIIGFFTRAGL